MDGCNLEYGQRLIHLVEHIVEHEGAGQKTHQRDPLDGLPHAYELFAFARSFKGCVRSPKNSSRSLKSAMSIIVMSSGDLSPRS